MPGAEESPVFSRPDAVFGVFAGAGSRELLVKEVRTSDAAALVRFDSAKDLLVVHFVDTRA
jgi:hypothetical protein